MAMGVGRGMLTPLVVLIFLGTLVELSLAGWAVNRLVDRGPLFGNAATLFFLIIALISGVVGAASIFSTVHHLRVWRTDTLAAAAATALIDLMLSFLALGLACKEINLGGRDRRLQALEAFVIILAGLKLFKILTLHAGIFGEKFGPAHEDTGGAYGGGPEQRKGGPPGAAAAV